MACRLAQKDSNRKSLYRRIARNEAVYKRVKNNPDRGILSVVAEEMGLTRERVRQIFRDEEMRRGDVFHKIVNGNARRLS